MYLMTIAYRYQVAVVVRELLQRQPHVSQVVRTSVATADTIVVALTTMLCLVPARVVAVAVAKEHKGTVPQRQVVALLAAYISE